MVPILTARLHYAEDIGHQSSVNTFILTSAWITARDRPGISTLLRALFGFDAQVYIFTTLFIYMPQLLPMLT